MASTTSVQCTTAAQPAACANRAAACALVQGASTANAGANDFGPAAVLLAFGLGVAAMIFAAGHH